MEQIIKRLLEKTPEDVPVKVAYPEVDGESKEEVYFKGECRKMALTQKGDHINLVLMSTEDETSEILAFSMSEEEFAFIEEFIMILHQDEIAQRLIQAFSDGWEAYSGNKPTIDENHYSREVWQRIHINGEETDLDVNTGCEQ